MQRKDQRCLMAVNDHIIFTNILMYFELLLVKKSLKFRGKLGIIWEIEQKLQSYEI